jgi:hypothetical protein
LDLRLDRSASRFYAQNFLESFGCRASVTDSLFTGSHTEKDNLINQQPIISFEFCVRSNKFLFLFGTKRVQQPVRSAYKPPASSTFFSELFSHNKPATSNQPIVFFSQNKSAPAISYQPNEQAANRVYC